MKQRMITLPDNLDALVDQERQQRAVSINAVIQDALTDYFGTRQASELTSLIGLGKSGFADISTRAEEILDADWGHTFGP